jgi:hypothetical protein
MVHPATDDRAYYATDGTTDRTADRGGHSQRAALRRLMVGLWTDVARSGARSCPGTCSRPGTRTASGSLVGRLFVGFVSV